MIAPPYKVLADGVIFISGYRGSLILGYRVKSKWARGSREGGFSKQAFKQHLALNTVV